MKQSQPFNRDYFHNNWCPMCDFMAFLIFWKKGRGSSNFRKIRATILKLHTTYIDQGTLVLNLVKNFFRFWIFWESSQNYLTQTNFDLSSWNFVHKCTNTEWYLILNFVKISQDLQILDEIEFFNFCHRDIKFKKFDVSMKLPLQGSQNQATYFLKQ